MGTVRNARVNQGGPKCAGIVGLGLIGGSFARGYAQAGVRVLAWDPDDDVMTAASMGTVAGELNDETLGECDIIVLACYPEACPRARLLLCGRAPHGGHAVLRLRAFPRRPVPGRTARACTARSGRRT